MNTANKAPAVQLLLWSALAFSIACNFWLASRADWSGSASSAMSATLPAEPAARASNADSPSIGKPLRVGDNQEPEHASRGTLLAPPMSVQFLANLSADPTYRPFALSRQKLDIITRYTDFFRSLRLSRASADRMRDLLAEEKLAIQELTLQARAEGQDSPALAQSLQQARADTDSAIRNLLGEDQYAQYATYRDSLSARSLVQELDVRLGYTSQPLSAEQKEALVRTLNASVEQLDFREQILYRARANMGEIYSLPLTDAVLRPAGGILSPGQLSTLMEMAVSQMDKSELDTKFYHARKKGG